MSTPTVVFAMTGAAHRNSRALKQLRALDALGVQLEVLSYSTAEELPVGQAQPVAAPKGGGFRFFWHLHRRYRAAVRQLPARVYHASDLYVLPAVVQAAKQHGARVVYDARELYPYVASTAGRPWVSLFWHILQGRYIRHADAVFTVNDSIADRLAEAHGITPPMVLHNVPAYQTVERTSRLRTILNLPPEPVLILHQGQMRKDRGCTLLVEAMQEVEGAVLAFLGGGPLKPELEKIVETLGLHDRVRFVPRVLPDVLLSYTASADIGVTLLEDTCLNHRLALPNKLFEYLMAGVPVLASDLPEIGNVVRSFEVGCVVDPADRAALVRVLQRMVDDEAARDQWRVNAPSVFETFNWARASHRLQKTYTRLLKKTNP